MYLPQQRGLALTFDGYESCCGNAMMHMHSRGHHWKEKRNIAPSITITNSKLTLHSQNSRYSQTDEKLHPLGLVDCMKEMIKAHIDLM